MRTVLSSLRGRDVLIAYPNYRQYGHLALEIVFGFDEARTRGVPVCFSVPQPERRAMLQLDCEGVEVVRPSALGRWWLQRRAVAEDVADSVSGWRQRVRTTVRDEARDAIGEWGHSPAITPSMKRQLKRRLHALKQPVVSPNGRPSKIDRPHYYRRRLLRNALPVRLTPEAEALARQQAAAAGIPLDKPIVTAHAREAGYKLGQEMQDTKPKNNRDDSTRNVQIESYFDAFDYLAATGHTVVRVGDASMRPVSRPGMIDLATSPTRTDLLELFCLLRSRFLIGSDSGPAGVVYLTNTPLLCTNTTDPIAAFPLRRDGIYMLKTVTDRLTGRRLRLNEMLADEYMNNSRNSRRYQYHDNSPTDILEASREMLELLEGRAPLTPKQEEWNRLVLAADAELRDRNSYVRKWGADEGFLGDGRMAAGFVERHL